MQALPVLPLAPLTERTTTRPPTEEAELGPLQTAAARRWLRDPQGGLPFLSGRARPAQAVSVLQVGTPTRAEAVSCPRHSRQAWPNGVATAGAPCGPLGCALGLRSTSPG